MPFSGHGCTATQCGGAELSWLERQRKNTELNISHRYELEVSLNGGTPKSSIFNRIFRYKLSIYWGTLPFMEVTNSSWFLLLHVGSTTYRWLALRSPTCMESPGGGGWCGRAPTWSSLPWQAWNAHVGPQIGGWALATWLFLGGWNDRKEFSWVAIGWAAIGWHDWPAGFRFHPSPSPLLQGPSSIPTPLPAGSWWRQP